MFEFGFQEIVLSDIRSRSKTLICKTLKAKSHIVAFYIKQSIERKAQMDNMLESLSMLIQASSSDIDVSSYEAKDQKCDHNENSKTNVGLDPESQGESLAEESSYNSD